jgi:hypothetical protein
MRLVLALVLAAGCADPDLAVGDAPLPPGKDDAPGYAVSGGKAWYLVGNALTPGDDVLELSVDAPSSAHAVDLFLDGHFVKRAQRTGGTFRFETDIASLAVGEHRVLLSADGGHVAFAERRFQRSHPLYVAVSNDWDDPDHGDDKLERQERLHARHPALVITHFVGPYTFTDPTVTPARRQLLVEWVTKFAQTKGDEIGLHVHPWCNFVETAGVTCRTSPSFAYASGDTTGYTVRLDAYTRPELDKLFAKASQLFVANGLPKPTSFRAGGWTAEAHVLAALATAGHVADSSGCNWSRLEEWKGHTGASLYDWNKEHWAPIDETSQPYYPSKDDMLADAAPHLSILEVPDNGLLVDYVTGAEMIQMFQSNFSGAALSTPTVYAIGYHPVSFSEAFFLRLDEALTEIDRHLVTGGTGPVIYVRMSDLARAFPR